MAYRFRGNAPFDLSAPDALDLMGTASPFTLAASAPQTLAMEDDDFAGDTSTTGTITIGESVTGVWETNDDSDWFAFTANAGDTYRFSIDVEPDDINVYDSNGLLVVSSSDQFEIGSVIFSASETGTYFVAANAVFTSNYTLSSEDLMDVAGSTATTATIAIGEVISGEWEFESDSDWYRFEAEAGDNVSFFLSEPEELNIRDADGNFLAGGFEQVNFLFEDAGTYYIDASSIIEAQYSLGAQANNDIPDNTTTTETIAIGETVDGEWEGVDFDSDWFRFEAVAGDNVIFSLDVPETVGIYDANGDFITSDLEQLAFSFDMDGTYYISVEGFGGTYSLSAEVNTDIADNVTTDAVIAVGDSIAGEWESPSSQDSDWYRFDATAGETVTFTLDTPDSLYALTLFDANGDFVASNFETLTFTFDDDATYYIAAEGFFGSYTLSLSGVVDDFAGDTSTSGVIELDSFVNGNIDFDGDADWFAIDLDAGQGVLFESFEVVDNIVIYDALGNFIDSSLPELFFTAAEAGTYFVAVEGSFETSYTLSATSFVDDFAGDTSTTGTVDVGSTANGTLEVAGDRDWFALEVTAGTAYQINLDAVDNAFDTILRIFDAEGNFLDQNDDFGGSLNSGLTYTATEDGIIFLSAADLSDNNTGDYTISANEVIDDFAGDVTTEGTIAAGEAVDVRRDFDGDQDWLAFTLGEDEIVEFVTAGSDLTIYDANGNFVTNGFGNVTAVGLVAGDYFLGVQVFDQGFGPQDTVVANLIEDDFSADADTEGTIEVGGTANGSTDFNGDADWFAIELEAGEGIRAFTSAEQIEVYDANGNQVLFNFGNSLEFTAFADSTYYIEVSGFFQSNYSLAVAELDDDFSNDTDTTAIVSAEMPVEGRIDFQGDTDFIAIEAEVGTLYNFALEGETARIQNVYDSAGNPVVFGNNFDGTYYLSPSFDGTYFIEVADFNVQNSSNASDYTLSVEEVDPLTLDPTTLRDLRSAYDSNTGIIYTTTAQGVLTRFDTATGEYIDGINLGGSIFQTSISPDGSTLYVNDFGTSPTEDGEGRIGRYISIDLETLETTVIEVPVELTTRGTFDIAATVTDEVLLTLSDIDFTGALPPVYLLDPTDPDAEPGIVLEEAGSAATLDVSEDGRYVLINANAFGDFSNIGYNATVFDTVTGNVIYEGQPILSGQNNDTNAISSAAGAFANLNSTGLRLTRLDGTELFFQEFPQEFQVDFSADQNILYTFTSTSILLRSVTTGEVLDTIDVSDVAGSAFFTGLIDGDGRSVFFLDPINTTYVEIDVTQGGIEVVGDDDGNLLAGTDGNDRIDGLGGDDVLSGGDGHDSLRGGDGDDVLNGNAGGDFVDGGAGDDRIFADHHDVIVGGDGFDEVRFVGTGDAYLDLARASIERATGGRGDDELNGTTATDDLFISGGAGDDVVRGGEGNDSLFGGQGADFIVANGGDDMIFTDGLDIIDGGTGFDTVTLRGGNTLNLGVASNVESVIGTQGNDDIRVDFTSVQSIRINGRGGDDTIVGSRRADELLGGDGNDTIGGNRGNDVIFGGDGDDDIFGGSGRDTLYGEAGADIINGASGNDTIYADTFDTIIGGTGFDTVFFTDASGVNVTFGEGSSVERVVGTEFDDTFTGSTVDVESFEGGAGDDTFNIGADDSVLGGAGFDRIFLSGESDGYTYTLAAGSGIESVIGGGQDDALSVDAAETAGVRLYGRDGNDSLLGGRGDDYMVGGEGDDNLNGGEGNDSLRGGAGNDTLFGGNGDDTVLGGAGDDVFIITSGADRLNGQAGADVFVFTDEMDARSVVIAFEDGVDLVDLSDLGVSDLDDVTLTATSNGVLVTVDGHELELQGVDIADIDADDFIFDDAMLA